MTDPPLPNPAVRLDGRLGPLEISTIQSAEDMLQQAEALPRHDSHADVMQAAHYYLTAAHFLENHDSLRHTTSTSETRD